jgi:hypothetical protein
MSASGFVWVAKGAAGAVEEMSKSSPWRRAVQSDGVDCWRFVRFVSCVFAAGEAE